MDHTTIGNPTNGNSQNPQSSETAELAESSGRPFLAARAMSAPAPAHETKWESTRKTKTHPPLGKASLPFHPTAHPKERLPNGFPRPSVERMFTGLLQPPRPVADAPSILGQLRNIVTYSWLNLLLVFLPISWAAVSGFPLVLAVGRKQAVSHCLSYSSEPTLMCTLWY